MRKQTMLLFIRQDLIFKKDCVIIMKSKFDESKHKRDKLGRFAKMSTIELAKEIAIELDNAKLFLPSKNGRIRKDVLSQKEWQLWYENQNNQEKSYLLNKVTLRRIVEIGDKLIFTKGKFVNPQVEFVIEFIHRKEIIDFWSEIYNGRVE